MSIEEIVVANVASIVILVVLFISRMFARRNPRREDKLFTALIFIGIFGAIFEMISFLVDGKPGTALRVINFIANTLLYCCTATVSVVWMCYVDAHLNRNQKKIRPFYWPFFIVFVILIIALIFNGFFQFCFKIGADNVYAREPFGYAFFVFPIFSFIFTIILYIHFRIKHGVAQFFPIWMFLTPVIVACIVQAIIYGISVTWLGCAIGLIGIYINIQSKFSLVDALTNLYNRAYIEHELIVARYSPRYDFYGIMLDLDFFKDINDKYGHSLGDDALIDAASILIHSTDRDSLAFRFAGDEFIILVRAPKGNREELEARVMRIEAKVHEEFEKFDSSAKKPYKLTFSMGHAFYNKN